MDEILRDDVDWQVASVEASTKPLTREDLEKAMQALVDSPRRGCPPHLVHPKASGWTQCANLCGQVVWVEPK